ncbi:MAG TPA: HAD family phosphatase [Planctomycetota bacterium]|nr:phosphatase [Planctomycetota bacterium]MDP7245508.1 HAD family phosphatase [Planctomycetota bacterium]HJM38570.1 HAD family phosphatase [Planctomycetota bacterium]
MRKPPKQRKGLPTPLRGVLFDLDGTLVDSEPLHHESAVIVLATHGHQVPVRSIAKFIGWSEIPFWTDLRQKYSLHPTPEQLAEERTEAFGVLLHERSLELLPGAIKILDALRQRGIPCAIASASPRAQIEHSLKVCEIANYFKATVSGHEDVERGKPHPDVFIEAAKQLGVSPLECLAVEDSANGTAAAVAAGSFTIRIPTPGEPSPPSSGEHLRLKNLIEVEALLL